MDRSLAALLPNARAPVSAGTYQEWPNVFSAIPVAKDVFEKRPR